MFGIFIRRPILAGVISVVITLLGLLACNQFVANYTVPGHRSTIRYRNSPLYRCECRCYAWLKTVATSHWTCNQRVQDWLATSVCTNDFAACRLPQSLLQGRNWPGCGFRKRPEPCDYHIGRAAGRSYPCRCNYRKEVNSMLMYLNIMSSDTTRPEKFVYNLPISISCGNWNVSTGSVLLKSWVAVTMQCVSGWILVIPTGLPLITCHPRK